MLDYLHPFKNVEFDLLTFLPGKKADSIRIEGSDYKNRGEYVEGSDLGLWYHVMLYKHDTEDEDKVKHQDLFECILVDPLEYVSGLIPSGFYGIIAKKTTTSNTFINDAFAKVLEKC